MQGCEFIIFEHVQYEHVYYLGSNPDEHGLFRTKITFENTWFIINTYSLYHRKYDPNVLNNIIHTGSLDSRLMRITAGPRTA